MGQRRRRSLAGTANHQQMKTPSAETHPHRRSQCREYSTCRGSTCICHAQDVFSGPQAQNVAYVHTKMVSKKSVCVRIDQHIMCTLYAVPTHVLGVATLYAVRRRYCGHGLIPSSAQARGGTSNSAVSRRSPDSVVVHVLQCTEQWLLCCRAVVAQLQPELPHFLGQHVAPLVPSTRAVC